MTNPIPLWLVVMLWLALTFSAFVCIEQNRTVQQQQVVIRALYSSITQGCQ